MRRGIRNMENVMWENETIYHYTSSKAINEIVTDNGISLWFSRVDCLNDITESRVVVDIQQQVCDELKEIYKEDTDKIRNLRPNFKELFFTGSAPTTEEELENEGSHRANITIYSLEAVPYICCFSYAKDDITMWNYYTKGSRYEGYNLGLNPYKMRAKLVDIEGNIINEEPKLRFDSFEVIYDREKQKDLVRKEIEHYLSKKIFSESEEHTYMLNLNKWALKFKNEVFKHEQEERLICYIPKKDNAVNFSLKDYIKFREINGCLVPYLNILIDKSALKEIVIGPLIEKEMAKSTIELLLELRGYESIEVDCSKVPVRY